MQDERRRTSEQTGWAATDEPGFEPRKRTWEAPVMEVRGSLLDITAAAAGPGDTDFMFDEGPSGG